MVDLPKVSRSSKRRKRIMNCNKAFSYDVTGHGQPDKICGKGNPAAVCSDCKDRLIIKLSKSANLDLLSKDENVFIVNLSKAFWMGG